MLLKAIDTTDGGEAIVHREGGLDVDPNNLPREGDLIDMGERKALWRVEGIVWSGHPARLEPAAIRLSVVATAAERAAEADRG